MDALALLCNLHGDGPVTLAALRDIGCEDLIGLEGLGVQLLGDLLRRDERGVERFRREARLLRERIEGDEEQQPPVPPPVRPHAVETPMPAIPEIDERAQSQELGAAQSDTSEFAELTGTGPVVEAVLEMWRTFDRQVEASRASNLLIESPLSGLRAEEVAALARVGVLTLEELAEADVLVLARETKLPYTHLAHMAFLARKSCAQQATLVPTGRSEMDSESELTPEPKRTLEPDPERSPEPDPERMEKRPEEGAAGPFA